MKKRNWLLTEFQLIRVKGIKNKTISQIPE